MRVILDLSGMLSQDKQNQGVLLKKQNGTRIKTKKPTKNNSWGKKGETVLNSWD